MPHPSKTKGNNFEREIVNAARKHGFRSERAWGSNGRSLGMEPGVDLTIEHLRIQAKRRKQLPAYLQLPNGCDVVVVRQDRGESLAIVSLAMLFEMLRLQTDTGGCYDHEA